MKLNKLLEAIKFGEKEMQAVRSNSQHFRVGIEYEFNVTEPLTHFEADPTGTYEHNFYGLSDALNNSMYSANDIHTDFIDSDYVDGLEAMVGNTDQDFNGLYELASILTKRVKGTVVRDTETQDMFGEEGKVEGFLKFFNDTANEVKDYSLENSTLMSMDEDTFKEICILYDIYMEGEGFGGDKALVDEFYTFLKFARLGGDELIFSNVENRSDTVLRFVKFLTKSRLDKLPSPDEMQYTFNGFDGNIDPKDIIDYEEEHGRVDFLSTAFANYINDMELVGDSIGFTVNDLGNSGVKPSSIREITTDHDEMVEVITVPLSVNDALDNIESMFEFIEDHGETHDFAGMHISISTRQFDLNDFNLMKFVTILDLPHILNYFPSRRHVQSLQHIVEAHIETFIASSMLGDIEYGETMSGLIMNAMDYVEHKISESKEQSIKFGDYKIMDGRIELRFFGGRDYHSRQDDIVTHLLRALYLLTFAYTDEHDKTYKKKVIRIVSNVFKEEFGVTYSHAYNALKEIHKLDPNLYLSDKLGKTDDIEDQKVREDVEKILKRYLKDETTIKQFRNFFF